MNYSIKESLRIKIANELGYIFDFETDTKNAFQRFKTKNGKLNGSYIAHSWRFDNKEYALISFRDWSLMNEYSTIKSWDERDKNSNNEDFKKKLKELEEERKFKVAEEEAKKAEEFKALFNKIKENKLTEEELPEYFKNKGFSIEDIKPIKEDLMKGDYFISYPLRNFKTGEITGIQRIYKDCKKIKGKLGYWIIGKDPKDIEISESLKLAEEEAKKEIQEEIKKNRIDNREKEEVKKAKLEELNKLKSIEELERRVLDKVEEQEREKASEYLQIVKSDKTFNVVFIAEGLATGLTVHLATGKTVYIATCAHQLKNTLETAIKQVFSKDSDTLFVIASDKDFKSKTGENFSLEAIKNKLEATYKLPYLSNKEEEKSLKSLDYDDLRQKEGLTRVSELLTPEKLRKKHKQKIHEINNCYVTFQTSGADSMNYETKKEISNFVIEPKHRLETEEGVKRFIEIKGKNDSTTNLISFDSDIFSTEIRFKEFVYCYGNFLLNGEIDLDKLRKHIEEGFRTKVTELEKIGKFKNAFYFENCKISSEGINYPDKETGFFIEGYDRHSYKLVHKLPKNVKSKPSLNLRIKREEAKELTIKLITTLKEAYGYNALLALGSVISGFFREEIAEITGTDQFPVCWLYGEPKAGKSRLLSIFSHLQGFIKDNGIGANSTEASILKTLKERNSLTVQINEIKPKHLEKVEIAIQMAFDNQIKTKQKKVNNEWISTTDKPEGFIIVDSNIYPITDSVLERIIGISFVKKDFQLSEAKKLNANREELSSITRYFLEDSLSNIESIKEYYKAINNQLLNEGYGSRDALNATYCSGIILLISKICPELTGLTEEIERYLKNWIEESKKTRDELSIFSTFFNYFLFKFIIEQDPKGTDKKQYIRDNILLEEGNELFISNHSINSGIENFLTMKKELNYSKKLIKDSFKSIDYITKDCQQWISGGNKKGIKIDLKKENVLSLFKDYKEESN